MGILLFLFTGDTHPADSLCEFLSYTRFLGTWVACRQRIVQGTGKQRCVCLYEGPRKDPWPWPRGWPDCRSVAGGAGQRTSFMQTGNVRRVSQRPQMKGGMVYFRGIAGGDHRRVYGVAGRKRKAARCRSPPSFRPSVFHPGYEPVDWCHRFP